MTLKTKIALNTEADIIRTETGAGLNTASRIGTYNNNMADSALNELDEGYVQVVYGSASDQAATIQAALDAASDGDTLRFKAGVVKVETQIDIEKNISIICDDNTVFQTTSIIKIFNASIAGAEGFTFDGGRFLGTATTGSLLIGIEQQYGIWTAGVSRKYIRNIKGNNLGGALIRTGTGGGGAGGIYDGGLIENCDAILCYNGLWIEEGSEYATINGCSAGSCINGLKLRGGNNVISNSNFSGCTTGLYIVNGGNSGHNNVTNVTANHCNLYCLHIDTITAQRGQMIVGCNFGVGGIYIKNSDGVNFSGCRFGVDSFEVDGCTIQMTGNFLAPAVPDATLTNGGQIIKSGNYIYNGVNDLIPWDTSIPDIFGVPIDKATTSVLGTSVDWSQGTFQPYTLTGSITIGTITNPSLGAISLTITDGTDVVLNIVGLEVFQIRGSFNPGVTTNILKLVCSDAATPVFSAEWINAPKVAYPIILTDENTEITTTGVKATFRMPYKSYLQDIRMALSVAVATANLSMMLKEEGVDSFSTPLTIDIGEKTSVTAATPVVISNPEIADDAEMTADVTVTGSAAKGAKITLYIRESFAAAAPPAVSTEAQDVLDRYSALTTTESDAITVLVNAFSVSLGNGQWSKIRQVWSLNLNATDRLIPFKAVGATAVNNGCTFDINGATGDGISDYIDLQWNPSDDGVSWDAQNNFIGFYMYRHPYVSGNDVLVGSYDAGFDDQYDILVNGAALTLVNFASGSFPANFTQRFADDTNYTIDVNRTSGNNSYLWENGINVETDGALGVGLTTYDLYLLARNSSGTAAHFAPATIPLVVVGDTGFDHAEWNTQVKIYLAALGMTIP